MDETPRDTPATPPAPLVRARRVSYVLDDLVRIPGTEWRVGLDPLVGLAPGVGDWATLAVSIHLLVVAAQLGAGPWLLVRMFGNVALDALLGLVPFVGDAFDLAWKANRRNLNLLEALLARPDRTRATSRWVVLGVMAGIVGAVAAKAWLAWWVLSEVIGLIRGLLG